jgi:hypothetical protein
MATIVAASCDLNTLVRGQKCFACLSQKEDQAAVVYFLEQRRAKLLGVTSLTANQLRAAAACLGCFPVDPMADGLDAFVAQAGAIAAGVAGSSTQTITQIRNAIKGLANTSFDELRTMEILLRCQSNAFQ